MHWGGSNFAGIAFPFLGTELRGEQQRSIKFIAVEPAACPTLTQGKYSYDFIKTSYNSLRLVIYRFTRYLFVGNLHPIE
ncbi:MAG: hypothetical protein EBE86_029910 [Hormoscilla sp. GUM202]|nr:hypothetical protein [Hormoscilla sp. GUM202]